jgi:hypothetical protein
LPRLFEAIERVNARLIIFDDFIDLLSHDRRWTDQRLAHLLADLNQHLIERNVACLLIRNCPARGGYARPSVLERSQRFLTVAASHLLLASDPIEPAYLLLTHVRSIYTALAPTLILHIQRRALAPMLPFIAIQGIHSLQARDFLIHRPDEQIRAKAWRETYLDGPDSDRVWRRISLSEPLPNPYEEMGGHDT